MRPAVLGRQTEPSAILHVIGVVVALLGERIERQRLTHIYIGYEHLPDTGAHIIEVDIERSGLRASGLYVKWRA